MVKITVNMLQNPAVIHDGAEVSFPLRRADALLYYMICHKTTTRKELVALLWESCDNETGHKNLRNTLYCLKKGLGMDVLISPRKTTLQINPQIEIDCDYLRFMEQGDYTAYNGSFLQGFSLKNAIFFEEWVEHMREKTREQYLRYLLKLAQEAESRQEIEQAEQYALEYMHNDPLDEQIVVFLMRLYRANKMYPKVARVYQKLRECLEEELGIMPLAETTALYYDAMNEWNCTVTDDEVTVAGDYLPASRLELVARMNNELRLFLAKPGKHTSLLINGEAGMGKSFLLESFLARANLANLLVLKGNCFQTETQSAYKPWNSVMITIAEYLYSSHIGLPETVSRTIAKVFPIFPGGSASTEPADSENQDEKELIECLLLLISVLARQTQILLIFEDILWMDVRSMELMDAVLRHVGPGQLMLIATSQDILPPRTEHILRAATDDKLLHTISLDSLTVEDVQAMMQLELGHEFPPHVVQRVHDETGGNPMLLYELLNSVTDNRSVESLLLQSRHLLDRRLIGLSIPARQLLDIISLFPGPAPCKMLASIYSKDDELLNASEELKRRALVVEQQLASGYSALTISYTRLRDMIYQQQSYFKRRPLHLRIARLLAQQPEELTVGKCERLCYHFTQADDEINALVYESERCLLLAKLRRAPLPLLPTYKEDLNYEAADSDKIQDLGSRLKALQHNQRDKGVFQQAHMRLLLAQGLTALAGGDNTAGLAALETLTQGGLSPDERTLLYAYRQLTLHHQKMFDMEQMDVYLALGSGLADKCGDEEAIAYGCWLRGKRHSLVGKYNESSYFLSESLERFQRLHEAQRYKLPVAGVYHALGLDSEWQGDYSSACAYYKQAVAELKGAESFMGVASLYADYGRAAHIIGDHGKARGLFNLALTSGNQAADLAGLAVAGAYMALYTMEEEDYGAASLLLSQAHRAATKLGMPFEQGVVYCIMSQLRQKLDMEKKRDNALDILLNRPLDFYCSKGLRLLEKTNAIIEREPLLANLRYSHTKSRPFTVPELYSKNKQFMTE